LQEAEFEAAKEHGQRPFKLIHWRDYTIGASEIDTRRKQLLEAGAYLCCLMAQVGPPMLLRAATALLSDQLAVKR
jgi:hypothetical protein